MENQLTPDGIKTIVKEALQEHEREKRKEKTYTVNQVRKRLGIAHETLTKRIKQGLIRVTSDGRISENEVECYLLNVK